MDRSPPSPSPPPLRPADLIAVVAALAAGLFLVFPFWPWVLLALWTAGLLDGVAGSVARVVGSRPRAAVVVTVGTLLLVIVPLGLMLVPLLTEGLDLGRRLVAAPSARHVLESLVSDGEGDAKVDLSPAGLVRLAGSYGGRVWPIARSLAGATSTTLTGLAAFVVTAYVRLAAPTALAGWITRHAPVAPRTLARLEGAFMETGRGLFLGSGGAALAQSAIATTAYLVLGVPHALVLGMLTFVGGLVPGIGTALVWGPVAIGLGITGRTGAAIGLAVVGTVLVGSVDNVLKPLLTRYGRLELPASVVFVAMLGGLVLVGPSGLLLGPLVVRLAKELVVLAREQREALATTPAGEEAAPQPE